MATQIEVVNDALIELGQTLLLTAMDDTSSAARVMGARWDLSRRTVLQARPWGFARARVQLAQVSDVPLFGLGAYYQKPADFVRFLLERDDPDQDYREEGPYILSADGAPLNITYIFDQTEVEQWSPVAADLLAAQLAARCAYAITGDKGVREAMETLYARRLSAASFVDSFNQQAQTLDGDVWIRSRH